VAPREPLRLTEEGWTLVELMLVAAMIAIITPAITFLFLKSSQGFAADEMHTQLARGNEYMMSRVENRLSASKHFYQGGASLGASFVADISFSGAPPTVTGTQLAQAQTSTSLSLDPTVSGYQPSFVGNSLFFSAYDSAQTFVSGGTMGVSTAPLTVSGQGVSDGNGTPMTLIIDLYRFYYYYLTPSTHPLPSTQGVTSYGLVEWESKQYLDYNELNQIPDPTEQNTAVSCILSKGLTIAYDSTQQAVTNAFYTISYNTPVGSSPAAFASIGSPTIAQAAVTYLCQVPTGIISRGFFYGISPNTASWNQAPSVTVPLYATAAAPFPGGFEVGLSGDPSGRQVLLRSCWVGLGAAPKVAYNDLTSVQSIRDDW
jgi:type II secretory pathway pseudopilin PulG